MIIKNKWPWLVVFTLALGLNISLIQSAVFGTFLALGYVYLIFKFTNRPANYYHQITLLFTAYLWLTIIGGAIYWMFGLSNIVAIIVLILSLPLIGYTASFIPESPVVPINISRQQKLLVAVSLLATLAALIILYLHATTTPIRSPWTIVPAYFWTVQFIFWISAIATLWSTSAPTRLAWWLYTLIAVNLFSVALVVYSIGYGFDGFIHMATEKLIAEHGAVYPKPLYYLGQYGFVVLWHKLSFWPVVLIDKYLLFTLTVVYLPLATLFASSKFSHFRLHALIPLTLAAIPATFLITTNPQNLANLLFLVLILLSQSASFSSPKILGLIAIAIATLHPIAGIPALLFVALWWWYQHYPTKHLWPVLTTIATLPILPLAFWYINKSLPANTSAASSADWSNLFYYNPSFNLLWDTIYLWAFNLKAVFVTVCLFGFWQAKKHSTISTMPYVLIIVFSVGTWVVLRSANIFNFLISYEQNLFAARFLTLGAIASLPFFISGVAFMLNKIPRHSRAAFQIVTIFLTIIGLISLYTTYPRFDNFQYDRGYSTGAADIAAVNAIHQNAAGRDYVVLANQATSAAALRELGFYKYYNRVDQPTGEQIFFYPIPTGGSLYQIYLEMVYTAPTREVAENAIALTGVDTVYLVLNDYWFNSEEIAEMAKTQTDEYWQVENDIWVFKFSKQ